MARREVENGTWQTGKVVDSHTGGESTRLVVGRGPDLGNGPNNVGYLGLCDHGTIGAVSSRSIGTASVLGQIRIETQVGQVSAIFDQERSGWKCSEGSI